jgi:hypothetical protein
VNRTDWIVIGWLLLVAVLAAAALIGVPMTFRNEYAQQTLTARQFHVWKQKRLWFRLRLRLAFLTDNAAWPARQVAQ